MNSRLAATHALTEKIVERFLGQNEGGLILSIDIGGSLLDVIAANAAEASGCMFLGSRTLLRHRAHLNSLGRQVRVATVLAEPVIFGRVDGWLRDCDSDDFLESYGAHPEKTIIRSIDGWIAALPPLRLVHFGDAELVMDQLSGARETIMRDRPLVTLYTARQKLSELLGFLESQRYRAFNLAGEPVDLAKPDPVVDFGWVVIPEEWQDELSGIAAEHARDADAVDPSPWEVEVDQNAFARQRRSAAVFGFLSRASQPLPLDKLITAENILCLNDCYPLETSGDHSWRWLGPRPRTRLVVPCPLPCAYRVEVNATGCRLKNGLTDFRIIAEGREVRVVTSPSLPGSLCFAGNVEPGNYAGYMEIDVISTGTLLAAGADPRTLRLSVESITISPWH